MSRLTIRNTVPDLEQAQPAEPAVPAVPAAPAIPASAEPASAPPGLVPDTSPQVPTDHSGRSTALKRSELVLSGGEIALVRQECQDIMATLSNDLAAWEAGERTQPPEFLNAITSHVLNDQFPDSWLDLAMRLDKAYMNCPTAQVARHSSVSTQMLSMSMAPPESSQNRLLSSELRRLAQHDSPIQDAEPGSAVQEQPVGPRRTRLATPLARPARLLEPSDDPLGTSVVRPGPSPNPFLPGETVGDHGNRDSRADTWQLPRLRVAPLTSDLAPSSPLAHFAPRPKRPSSPSTSNESPELKRQRLEHDATPVGNGLFATQRRSMFLNEMRVAAMSADPDDAEQSRIRDLVLAVLDREE